MKPALDHKGYLRTVIKRNGRLQTVKIHRLVADAFLPDPKEQVNHKNFIKTDNHIENLEWMTNAENYAHAKASGRNQPYKFTSENQPESLKGESNGQSVLTEEDVREIRRRFKPRVVTREILALEFNVKSSTIKDVVNRKSWRHVV
jgi:hypothetical protein